MGKTIIVIYKKHEKLRLKITYSDGSSSDDEVKVGNKNKQTTYTVNNPHGEYYLLEPNGDLGMYGNNGKFENYKVAIGKDSIDANRKAEIEKKTNHTLLNKIIVIANMVKTIRKENNINNCQETIKQLEEQQGKMNDLIVSVNIGNKRGKYLLGVIKTQVKEINTRIKEIKKIQEVIDQKNQFDKMP